MAKIILTDVSAATGLPSGVATVINNNNADLETAIENTLSRDGTAPNAMNADFDMNDNDILNVGTIDATTVTATTTTTTTLNATTIYIGGEELDVDGITGPQGPAGATGATGAGVVAGGTTGQALVKASNTDYDTTWTTLGSIASQSSASVSITGGSISGITDLAIADGGTGASDAAQARENLVVPTFVATRAALKALDTTKDTLAYLTENGREGMFVWTSGNYSTQITADTQEGIYVKANAIASTSGSWIRQYDTDEINALWFGAIADSSTDNSTAFQAAIDFAAGLTNGGTVLIPDGTGSYDIDTALVWKPLVSFSMGTRTKIRATTAMGSMLASVHTTGMLRSVRLNGGWFDANFLATCCIEEQEGIDVRITNVICEKVGAYVDGTSETATSYIKLGHASATENYEIFVEGCRIQRVNQASSPTAVPANNYGIWAVKLSDSHILDNTIINVKKGIYGALSHCKIELNHIWNYVAGVGAMSHGIHSSDYGGVHLIGNQIDADTSTIAILIDGASPDHPSSVICNQVNCTTGTDNTGYAFGVGSGSLVVFSGNVITCGASNRYAADFGGTLADVTRIGTRTKNVVTPLVDQTVRPILINANTGDPPTALSGTLLEIAGADATLSRVVIDAYGSQPVIQGRRSAGTRASPTTVSNGSQLLNFGGIGYDGTAWGTGSASNIVFTAKETWTTSAHGAGIDFVTTANTQLTASTKMTLEASGLLNLTAGSLGRRAPVTKTADFTVADNENWLINNKSGSSCTVTLPAASSWTGREIMIKNIQAQTVVSASSNVIPLAGGVAGTAILSANAGRWCTLVSNGTNWEIMAGVI